jgi:hypothetical protein
LRAAIAAAAVTVPIALWFMVHPASYVDTFGRWFLHAAHIRNPLLVLGDELLLGDWASIY